MIRDTTHSEGRILRQILVIFSLLAFMAVAGCASLNPFPKRIPSTPPSDTQTKPSVKYDRKTRPYTVLGTTYYPLQTAEGYDEIGMASWYGKDFHGNKTANGQIYNMYGISAAHKTLPLGTQVKVTNLENNRSVILTINDRGPFVHGRILDLSYGAAKWLDTVERGVAKVRITAISSGPIIASKSATTATKYYHVRVGAFAVRANAEQTHRKLVRSGYRDARITKVNRNGLLLHVVEAGSFTNRDKAEQVMERLKPEFPTCYIVS